MATQYLLIEELNDSGVYLGNRRALSSGDALSIPSSVTLDLSVTLSGGAAVAAGQSLAGAGALTVSSAASGDLTLHSDADLVVLLGDAAGSNKLSIVDSGGSNEVASVDSDGNAQFDGTLDVTGDTTVQNMLVEGTFNVTGDMQAVAGTVVQYEDTVLLLGKDVTGVPALDLGWVGERGDSNNVFMGWDESADEFVLVETDDTGADGAINVLDYANLRMGALVLDDSIAIAGGAAIVGFQDDDNFASAAANQLASSESIKAYVDAQIGGSVSFANLSDTVVSAPAGGHMAIYDGTDSWDNVAMSGDGTLAASGAFALTATSNSTLTTLANVVTVGALTSGSIGVGFGTIALGDDVEIQLGASTDFTIDHIGTSGNTLFHNKNASGWTIFTLGSDDTNTRFEVERANGTSLLWLDGNEKVGGAIFDAVSNDASDKISSANQIKTYVDGVSTLSSLVTVGALNSGSIASGFGNIDIGSSTLDAGATTLSSLTLGSVSVTAILDEDAMGSDSATALATQQSIKAYVDAQVTASDLDTAGDSGTGAVDLDSQSLSVVGTNGITTTASAQSITVDLDATNSRLTNLDALVEVGALDAGSITSGFSSIDIGSGPLDAGAATVASLTVSGASALNDDVTVASGKEVLHAGFAAATTAAAANNLLAVAVDETGLKARLPDVDSATLALSRVLGVWRTGGKICKDSYCGAILVENTVDVSIGDELVASKTTDGRVTVAGSAGAPAAGDQMVVIGIALSNVTGGTDQTVAADLRIERPVSL